MVFTYGFMPSVVERIAHDRAPHSLACSNVAPSPGIEIEVQVVRPVDIVAAGVPLIEIDAAEIDHPQQRRQVVDHREVHDFAVAVIDRADADPRRTWRAAPLS